MRSTQAATTLILRLETALNASIVVKTGPRNFRVKESLKYRGHFQDESVPSRIDSPYREILDGKFNRSSEATGMSTRSLGTQL